MKNRKNRIASIFMAGAILSSTLTPTVLAVENSSEETKDHDTAETVNRSIKISKVNETETYQLEGNLEENADYDLVIGEYFRESVQTDKNGTFKIDLTKETELTLEDQFKVISTSEEVIVEGNLKDIYVEDTLPELISPEIDTFSRTNSTLSGYNHNGDTLVVSVNKDTVLTYKVSIESEFSIHIENEIKSGDKLSVYVEDSNGNRSESIEVGLTSVEEMESIEEPVNTANEEDTLNDEASVNDSEKEVPSDSTTTEKNTASVIEKNTVSTFSTKMSVSSSKIDIKKEPLGKKYHFVQPNETLYSLAKAYDTTVDHIMIWNDIKDASQLKSGDLISVDGIDNYDNITKESKVFTSNQDFLNYITPQAKTIAKDYNLYTSIMIAQSLHESNWGKSRLAKLGNNLFGVKGSYEGNSIVMLTWEEKPNGEIIWIQDSFRLYPSFYESIVDNAIKLRHGVSWNKNYYSGAWVENTASHMDATEWLTGRYATDSKYATKLNNTINSHKLLEHDEHIVIKNPIISQQYINKLTYLSNKSSSIYSQPIGTASSEVVDHSSKYMDSLLTVKQEKVNNLGSWHLLYKNDIKIGWINEKDITDLYYPVNKTAKVSYGAHITKPWSINSNPWGTPGAKPVVEKGSLVNKMVTIKEEKTTDRATYALISIDGDEIGWIDKTGLEPFKALQRDNVNYDVNIKKQSAIYSLPYGLVGFQLIQDKAVIGNKYRITQEVVTPKDTYVLLTQNGNKIGWIEKSSVEQYNTVLSTTNVSYAAEVIKPWSINTQPWGTKEAELVMSAEGFVGRTVEVVQEKVTSRSTYALLKADGKELGWLDKKGLKPFSIQSKTDENYDVTVTKNWSVNTQPWGILGYKPAVTNSIVGNDYRVIQEAVTPRSTYVLLSQNGQPLGWIDKNGVEKQLTVLSTNNVSYAAVVNKSWSINTQPWGTKNAQFVMSAEDYVERTVEVVQEKVTSRSTYGLLVSGGKELGWFDIDGLTPHTIQNREAVNYDVTVTKNWSVNTLPWGVKGYESAVSNSIVGNDYRVIQEVVTPRSTYVLLTVDGQPVGWIDKNGVEKQLTVLSTENVSYAADVNKGWSINTQPWGTKAAEFIMSADKYVGRTVQVVQEKVTSRSTYGLLVFNGKELGWFDVDGLSPHTIQSKKSVSYEVTITNNWSVNTLPWGIRGFEQIPTTNIVGEDFNVTQEAITPRTTYVLLAKNGQTIGWLDKRATKSY